MRTIVMALLISCFVATPALATSFYAAKNKESESCHVVLAKPDGQVMEGIGGPYGSYDEAMAAIRDNPACGEAGTYK